MGRRQPGMDVERRKFLKAGAYLLGIAAMGGYIAYHSLRDTEFSEAYENEKLRPRWAHGLKTREYAKIAIATPPLLEELKAKKNYTPPKGAFAATFPDDDSRIGSGTRSNVYVFPECFDPVYKKQIEPMGIIIENVIENHELVHADHFAKGIPGIQLPLFLRKDNTLDKRLFTAVSEVLAYKSEFSGLERENNRFVAEYRSGLKQLVKTALLEAISLTNDKSIIDRLQNEAKF
jgi:hypothetical protein